MKVVKRVHYIEAACGGLNNEVDGSVSETDIHHYEQNYTGNFVESYV